MFAYYLMFPPFTSLSAEEMHARIISERELAISMAQERGEYGCCISPACTMCYMEANQWNNHKAGTCACDEAIARGEKPCPQCERGLIKDTGISCEITSEKCEQ